MENENLWPLIFMGWDKESRHTRFSFEVFLMLQCQLNGIYLIHNMCSSSNNPLVAKMEALLTVHDN